MLKLPVAYAIFCYFLLSSGRKATAQQAEQQDAIRRKKCGGNGNIEVSFNLTEIKDRKDYEFDCVEYLPENWLHLRIGGEKVVLDGYEAGCFDASEKQIDPERVVEVRCSGQPAAPIQPRVLPKKRCTLQKNGTSYRFDVNAKKDGSFICGIWKEEKKTMHIFSFSVSGKGDAGSPSATSSATVPDGQKLADQKELESAPVADAHPVPNNAVPAGEREELAATTPLGSTGSSGAHRDGLTNDPAVSSTQTSPNENDREKEPTERSKNGEFAQQTSFHSPSADYIFSSYFRCSRSLPSF
ncbi:hypothetical protein, conserved in T. vivax, (fragment), partial [Trypanosoma vivax Y486]